MPLPPLVEPIAALSETERRRTARHASLVPFGELGQRRLAAAHVAVVGAGGLGSPVVLALAAAGVGTLTVIDDDVVETTNLQRQVMHRLSDVGASKVDSAVRAAADLAPETRVIAQRVRLDAANAAQLLAGAHLVIDGTDTFDTRELVAGACDGLGVPLVWGTVQGFDAQVTVFWSRPPAGVPAVQLRDLYPPGSVGEVPSCAQTGVLGALCLQVGSLLAIEAVKLIAGIGRPLLGRVLVIDGLGARQREVPLRAASPAAAPAADVPHTAAPAVPHLEAPALAAALAAGTAPALVDVREPAELALRGAFPGAVNLPLHQLLADPGAVKGPVVVVCQVGARALTAARALRSAGVEASVLAGGADAWDRLPAGAAR